MSDISISYLFNLTFDAKRTQRSQDLNGSWIETQTTVVSGVPCCINRLTQQELTVASQFEGKVTDVLSCPAGTPIIRGDVIVSSNGLAGRVMEVYDAANRGHHLVAYLDRREYRG